MVQKIISNYDSILSQAQDESPENNQSNSPVLGNKNAQKVSESVNSSMFREDL
jgi:hypothetical protein